MSEQLPSERARAADLIAERLRWIRALAWSASTDARTVAPPGRSRAVRKRYSTSTDKLASP